MSDGCDEARRAFGAAHSHERSLTAKQDINGPNCPQKCLMFRSSPLDVIHGSAAGIIVLQEETCVSDIQRFFV